MRSIYLGARQVVVWLGEEDDAKIALDYFQTPYNKRNEALSRTVFNACQALFLQRPWWSRTWILQEVLHHNPVLVHLGNIILSLDEICDHGSLWDLERWACEMRYPEWVERKDNELQVFETVDVGIAEFDPVMTIGEQRKLLKENPDKLTGRPEQAPTLSLIKALQSYRSHQCGRQVDKVFALIGMADLGLYEPLIDYNMSKRATYTATMQSIFERDALLLVESPQRPISSMELPSWVPDWTTQQTLLAMHLAADLKKFNTVPVSDEFPLGSLRKQEEPYSFRGDTLVLQAIHVGTIISACFTMVRFGERGPPQTVKLFKYTESPSFEQEGVNHSANVAGDYVRDVSSVSLLKTNNSSLGPYWAEKGDIIVITTLSSIPIVLRRNAKSFLLVGGCWLVDSKLAGNIMSPGQDPGFSKIMYGSAWSESKLEKFYII
ncbi:hypothetical protein ACEPPN_003068 [Leptodophora sp. 'Broadleaf-Isolate-01']